MLLVEDSELNIELVKRVLEKFDLNISVATTGADALVKASQQSPDLVILDLGLPDMNGYNVKSQMDEIPGLKKTPVIAFTANVTGDEKQKCMEKGFLDFVSKPISVEHFKKVILSHLT